MGWSTAPSAAPTEPEVDLRAGVGYGAGGSRPPPSPARHRPPSRTSRRTPWEHATVGDRVSDRYSLLRVLGEGNSGMVWLARDEVLRRQVALKQLPRPVDEQWTAALLEARAAAAVRHRNVVDVHDIVVDEAGAAWIVMEALDGQSLADWIVRTGGLPVPAVRALAHAVVEALGALHSAGVVHRDVKPSNLQICRDGRTVLLDLGVATHDEATDQHPPMVAGTLAYLAPEAVTEARSSPASDLYALGATLFCALEGVPPFPLACLQDLVEHAANAPAPPRSLHAGPLTPLVEGLLQPRPGDRWSLADARALLDRLDRPDPEARTRWAEVGPGPLAPGYSGAPLLAGVLR